MPRICGTAAIRVAPARGQNRRSSPNLDRSNRLALEIAAFEKAQSIKTTYPGKRAVPVERRRSVAARPTPAG
jgi:hypothetical protein